MVMACRLAALLLAACVTAGTSAAEQPAATSHRVWLLNGVPDESALAALRSVGVSGLVVPVGRLELLQGRSRLSLLPLPEIGRLGGWPVTLAVWVEGSGDARGDAGTFVDQIAPVQRMLARPAGVVLATTHLFPGAVAFASELARASGTTVELAAAAAELRGAVPRGGWQGVRPLALAFGLPASLGFPAATLQDDAAAIEDIDASGATYRIAVVIEPHVKPAPGPAGASLAELAAGDVASFDPGARGEVFRLRRPLDWGGIRLETGQTVEIDATDTARYNRDLGLALRPVRFGLVGWDTIGAPRRAPAIGMSLEAFIDYLQGNASGPRPRVDATWASGGTLRLTLANPSPHASLVARTGNFVEVVYPDTVARDITLGQFSGAEYGRIGANGSFQRVPPHNASAIRLYTTYLGPGAEITGGVVSFVSRPREVSIRWGVRLGDGQNVVGEPTVTRP